MRQLAQSLTAEHGGKVDVMVSDLVQPSQLSLVEQRLERGGIDLLVNNAGIGDIATFAEQSRETHTRMVTLNSMALMRLCHAAVQGMVPRGGGAVINVASGFAFDYMPGAAVYAATKAFVVQLTKILDEELAVSGMRFQALIPGLTRTELGGAGDSDFFDQFPPEMVMEPRALVDVSLASLALGELVCFPRTEDSGDYQRVHEAVRALGRTPPHSAIASRYRTIMESWDKVT